MRLPYPLAIVVILLGLMLVSCVGGTVAPKLEDVAPHPKLIVHIAPRDRNTRRPVTAPVTVLWGGG